MKYILILLLSTNVFAQTNIVYSPANEYVQGIQLNTKATSMSIPMPLTGLGVATVKVGILRVKIAVNQFFTQFPRAYIRNENLVLNSLNNTGLMAMKLTFLRGLDHTQLEAFISNYIQTNLTPEEMRTYKQDIESLLSAISTDSAIYYGQSITLILDRLSKSVHYQNTKGQISNIYLQNQLFIDKILSIWFGRCPDQDCYNLKMSLLMEPRVTPRGAVK